MPVSHTEVITLSSGQLEYRLDRHAGQAGPAAMGTAGPDGVRAPTVLICHGGHLRAEIAIGEDLFAQAGWTVLVPSRPGYGRTPLTSANENPADFADQVAELCEHLGIESVVVLGMSAGATSALHLTTRHPDLVERLILASGLSSLAWPDPVTRLASSGAFHPWLQSGTWSWVRMVLTATPGLGLRVLLGSSSTLPPDRVIADLTPTDYQRAVTFFKAMDSGAGFANDLAKRHDEALQRAVRKPTLIVASPTDGAVPYRHALHLCETIRGAQVARSPSLSHVLWLGSGAAQTESVIFNFAAGIADGMQHTAEAG